MIAGIPFVSERVIPAEERRWPAETGLQAGWYSSRGWEREHIQRGVGRKSAENPGSEGYRDSSGPRYGRCRGGGPGQFGTLQRMRCLPMHLICILHSKFVRLCHLRDDVSGSPENPDPFRVQWEYQDQMHVRPFTMPLFSLVRRILHH